MKIAIDQGLSDVKDFLITQGLDVQDFEPNENNLNSFDAVVVSGQSENFMGMQNISTPKTIIEADGLTPQEVFNRIQNTPTQ